MSARSLQVLLVGPVSVVRGGQPASLPRSRKLVGLLAYLALESVPQTRARLCDLLWSEPSDPRAELRWCLSKLRGLIDEGDTRRVVTTGSSLVQLDLTGVLVDATEIERTTQAGLSELPTAALGRALELFRGDLLEGIELGSSPELTAWLAARRQRFRELRVALAAELAERATPGSDDAWRRLEAWHTLAPLDGRAHRAMLRALLGAQRLRDADAHLARAIRAFEQEGLDWADLRSWWLAEKASATALGPSLSGLRSMSIVASDPREPAAPAPNVRRRASVAIMPFAEASTMTGQLGHGLTDDIITRLAKLRALFVIARGTTYALGERGVDALEAGRILDVDYVVSGRIRQLGARVSVMVELAEATQATIVWTDELACEGEATFDVLDAIVNRIVAAIAEEIETAECHRAILKPPSSLDAWEAYHRGLWHMYRFRGPDNREADRFFRGALELDPTFARAHAGLSFTHFQNVFLGLTPDRERQMDLALETAADSLATDERDPTAHWAMGRALWLRGEQDESLRELSRSIELSPNFALGHYTLGFVQAQSGDPRMAIAATNTSRELSPFDPLQFGMLGSRAVAHMRLGELGEAAEWALRAISRPNAHTHILAIAVSMLSLVERREEARKLVAQIRAQIADYDIDTFLRAFRFDAEAERTLRRSARSIGFGA
jgi:TolB-like protein/Flp pilus assembly protein TadD